jgi:hypothetical protein
MDGDGCTGTLVTHEDGNVECLDLDCLDVDAARHDWRLSCADLGEPCAPCLGRGAGRPDVLHLHQRVA